MMGCKARVLFEWKEERGRRCMQITFKEVEGEYLKRIQAFIEKMAILRRLR